MVQLRGFAAIQGMYIMGIWHWLLGQRRGSTISEVAQLSTALVVESIRPLVEKRIVNMGVHEARGYVRARAGHLVREAVEMVTAHDPPAARHDSTVVLAAAMEELLRVLYRRPVQAPFKQRRAA